MANVIDSLDDNIQMTKTDRNNNTTNKETSPSVEQCDSLLNGNDEQQQHHQALSTDDQNETIINITSSFVDENETSTNIDSSSNVTNSYKDFSGIDTESFITTTLRNNRKDRTLLLTLEKVFQDFIQNEEQTTHQFQAMNSYERMIVHRVAAFFGLDHNVDKNGQSIIVTKTANTRIPDLSFQNFIPADELSNGAVPTLNSTVENSTRRVSRRNEKNSNQSTTSKPSFERSNYYTEHRDKTSNNSSLNKLYRKQQRFNSNQYVQQTNIHPSSHLINPRAQPMYSPTSNLYYQQQRPMNPNYKQPTTVSPMYNFLPMMSPTSFQQGNGMSVPILLHQQPNGQIQYVFPTQQPHSLSADGQYMPVYPSEMIQPVVDNTHATQPPFVHLYPTHAYPHVPQTAYFQRAPSLMIPPNNQSSIQYATNQLATLNLQSHYDNSRFLQSNNSNKSLHQSSVNGLTRMSNYPPYRHNRPMNTNSTDKPIPSIENDMNHNSDQILLSEPNQEKD
ncbi:hypothetical protein I4U23_025855 [Adineta vaga]|nr:hypothetical protein I4U23_025855 [Adineta vaga]